MQSAIFCRNKTLCTIFRGVIVDFSIWQRPFSADLRATHYSFEKAASIEITNTAEFLEMNDRPTIVDRIRCETARCRRDGNHSSAKRFTDDAAAERASRRQFDSEDTGKRRCDV